MSEKWTSEHDEALGKLRASGLSGSQIANALHNQFGAVYSRNAVIGRMNRLGLCGKMVRASKPKISIPRLRPQRRAQRPVHFGAPLHLPLIDLEPGQCKWPYGDGPFTFCGCTALDEASYCPTHQALSVGRGTPSEQAAA